MTPVWAWSSSTSNNAVPPTSPVSDAVSKPIVKEFGKCTSSSTTGSSYGDDEDEEDWPTTWLPDEELTELEIFEIEERRAHFVRLVCLAVISLLVLVVCFLVVRTDGVRDPFVYACLGVIAALLLILTPLRCLGILESRVDTPLGAMVIWLLCLLLCLAPVSKKQRLYGVTPEEDDSLCEEGAVAQWISLVLALTAAFLPMPSLWYCVLAQMSCATYLVLGLALSRPECNDDRNARSVFGGPLLGLPPLFIATFHLYSLVAVLMCLQYQITSERRMESVAAFFLRGGDFRRSTLLSRAGTSQGEFVIRIGLETLLDEVCREERRWKRFVTEVRKKAPWGSTCSSTWLTVVGVLVEVISLWREQLQSQPGFSSPDDKKFVEKVLDYAHEEETSIDALTQFVADKVAESMEAASVSNAVHKEHSNGHGKKSEDTKRPSKSPSIGARGGPREFVKTVAFAGATELLIGEWDFNALDVNRQNGNHVLQIVGLELLRSFTLFPPDALPTFLQRLEKIYNDKNPYHTHVHAADMTNAFYYLVSRCGLWQSCEMPEAQYAAMLIAGLGHDVGHFGRNNMFLISKRAELALTYNDRSVLENMHASTLVQLLDDADEGMKLFGGIPGDQVTKTRHLIIHLILGTDTQKHLEELGSFRFRLGADGFDPFREAADQNQVFSMLFRSADIGHSAKDWELHREWSHRVTQEFHAQGDEEKALGLKVSPLCEREGFKLAASQVGFLQFICLPTWRELSRLEEVLAAQAARVQPLSKPQIPPPRPVKMRTSGFGGNRSSLRNSSRHSMSSLASGGVMENSPSTKSSKSLDAKTMRRLVTTSIVPLPATTLGANSTPVVRGSKDKDKAPNSKKRWLTEVCLALCEKNFQAWKAEQDADRVEVASNRSPSAAPD